MPRDHCCSSVIAGVNRVEFSEIAFCHEVSAHPQTTSFVQWYEEINKTSSNVWVRLDVKDFSVETTPTLCNRNESPLQARYNPFGALLLYSNCLYRLIYTSLILLKQLCLIHCSFYLSIEKLFALSLPQKLTCTKKKDPCTLKDAPIAASLSP